MKRYRRTSDVGVPAFFVGLYLGIALGAATVAITFYLIGAIC